MDTTRTSSGWGGGVVLALLLSGCSGDHPPEASRESYDWGLPDGLPSPPVPSDNPMSEQKVELGRHLFYDRRLSYDENVSCASCHKQELAFSDNASFSEGGEGGLTPRNSMTLANVGYRATFTWANPVLGTLEEQALVPLLGEFPVELGWSGREREMTERLQALPLYQDLFFEAFESEDVTLQGIAFALASFQRTLISFDSPYDRFLTGQEEALSDAARRGMQLFFSERTECYHCHSGSDFTASYRNATQTESAPAFFNNALYNLDEQGRYPTPNVGLIEFTNEPRDMGKFRVPTLRNIELTAPYMHDGSIETLEGVLQHYRAGGRTIDSGVHAGIGAENPYRDSLVFPLDISDDETRDIVEFLRALTDETFITNERFADPFVPRE